jgi:allophanate hydrolase
MLPFLPDLTALRRFYASGGSPLEIVEWISAACDAYPDKAVFITRVGAEQLRAAAQALMDAYPDPESLPLWGVPFAVKDNIDVAGLPTTAACPAFAYAPVQDAHVVARLRAAGAIVIGKSNLDQFATGLNGTRSPYGAPRCVFDADYISGGSSSGSSVAVAAGLCSFALGTDTAGSGRVPAAFNNIVGIKPTLGLLSTTGVVPACRSVDAVSIFAGSVADGVAVRKVAEGFDAADAYSRHPQPSGLPTALRIGVLGADEREFYGNGHVERCYDNAIAAAAGLGATIVEIDYAPFRLAADLLYNGPWVAERLAAIESFYTSHAADMDPTVRTIVAGAEGKSAADAFKGRYRLEALKREAEAAWDKVDVLLLPTVPTQYTVAAMQADPIGLNSHLGRYTNFVNLFDLAAIAIPAGFDAETHLPAGVTLVGKAFSDDALAPMAGALHQQLGRGIGRDLGRTITPPPAAPADDRVPIVVVGAHLSGMPLNHELVALGGRLLKACRTAGDYRLFALPNTTPPKPGLVRAPGFAGAGLAVEVWSMPAAGFGTFVSRIPAPLGIGKIILDDGSAVSGFLCEQHALEGAREVTQFGGWRDFVASTAKATAA